jgi:hypothetical protein
MKSNWQKSSALGRRLSGDLIPISLIVQQASTEASCCRQKQFVHFEISPNRYENLLPMPKMD